MNAAPLTGFYTLDAAARRCGFGRRGSLGFESVDDGVMERRAELFDGLILGVGPGAVGEEGDGEAALGVAPERGSGVSEMAEGMRRKHGAGLRWWGGRIPGKGSGAAGSGVAGGEEVDGFGEEKRGVRRSGAQIA